MQAWVDDQVSVISVVGFCEALEHVMRAEGLQKLFGNVAAIFGKLSQHGLMQPHIHLGGVAHLVGRRAQLPGQFFACSEAAVEVEQLHQVDN